MKEEDYACRVRLPVKDMMAPVHNSTNCLLVFKKSLYADKETSSCSASVLGLPVQHSEKQHELILFINYHDSEEVASPWIYLYEKPINQRGLQWSLHVNYLVPLRCSYNVDGTRA